MLERGGLIVELVGDRTEVAVCVALPLLDDLMSPSVPLLVAEQLVELLLKWIETKILSCL